MRAASRCSRMCCSCSESPRRASVSSVVISAYTHPAARRHGEHPTTAAAPCPISGCSMLSCPCATIQESPSGCSLSVINEHLCVTQRETVTHAVQLKVQFWICSAATMHRSLRGMKRVAPGSAVIFPAPEVCSGKKSPAFRALPCQLAYVLRFAGVFGIKLNTCISKSVIQSTTQTLQAKSSSEESSASQCNACSRQQRI